MTAKEFKAANPDKDGNLRDYASVEQLVVLASLESQNALLIQQKHSPADRLVILNELAVTQMKSLVNNSAVAKLASKPLLNDKH
jgi:hypothetical protein